MSLTFLPRLKPWVSCYFFYELSPSYGKGQHLSFEYKANSQVLRYEIGKDIELKTYDDFEGCMENLIRYIGQNIEEMINDFKGGTWRIEDVVCDIEWQVDKIKK